MMTTRIAAPARPLRRSAPLASLVALAALTIAGSAVAAPVAEPRSAASIPASAVATTTAAVTTTAPAVSLTPIVNGLASPTQVIAPGDGSGRLFVVQQGGRIRVIKSGVLQATPFINLSSKIVHDGERGLLGLAFHPNYDSNGRFFVYYTRKSDGAVVINRYRVSGSDPDVADPASRRRIIKIKEPFSNHNGGRMAFGPDGYLYVGTGDGGSAGDPGNRARNIHSLLGKMLRIDVDRTTRKHAYKSPASNPYVGHSGLNEIWSRGLRNPWGWSFDRVSGDLWIGDVGQDRIEEIDRAPDNGTHSRRGRGVDFGWSVMEGRKCYRPRTGCNTHGKRDPLTQYNHSQGCSVTGGYAYRGSAVAALAGRYVFGDWCSGTIWTISRTAAKPATKHVLLSTSLHVTSFGEDESGELYVLDGTSGTLYRMDPA